MSDSAKPVLIGDANRERVAILERILLDEFRLKAVVDDDFDQIKARVRDAVRNDFSWPLVLIGDNLPASAFNQRERIFPIDVANLRDYIDPAIRLGYIFSAKELLHRAYDRNLHYLRIPLPKPNEEERNEIISTLKRAGLEHAGPAPIVRLAPDPILHEQIRALSDNRDLETGRKYLSYLIRNLSFSNSSSVAVAKIGQGKSGARVFRIRPRTPKADKTDFVLKLSSKSDQWKLDLEVARHKDAAASLGVPGYQKHVAELRGATSSGGAGVAPDNHIAEYGNWCAVCYDFLGGLHGDKRFGPFLDLETALIAKPEWLQAKTKGIAGFEVNATNAPQVNQFRRQVLDTMLKWLCDTWYQNKNHVRRDTLQVWQATDRDVRKYPSMPPYQLAGKTRGYILSFLDSAEAEMGERFFDDWAVRVRNVRRFVDWHQSKRSENEFFKREISMLLSPVHGDLNANNILLWLKEARPFLIDFPCYQKNGHALQDLASLEVALKFTLMDRQGGSPKERLRAFDYTHSQMDIWKQMEDFLVSDACKVLMREWRRRQCFRDNVALCFELVCLVREYAKKVQAQTCGEEQPPFFIDEYLPALLYHTVRAVGYTSLSLLKRLLAIYSASAILDKLQFQSEQPNI